MELGFRIPIVRGIPDSLSCIPDSIAKICLIPLYGARLEIPESFNLLVSCSTLGSINLKKESNDVIISNYFFPNVVILKITLTTPFACYNVFLVLTFESVYEMGLMCDHSMKITENFYFYLSQFHLR